MRQESYTPAEVENLTGWLPAGQRDLRRKDYLRNYGFQKNGRWLYSERDVVAFWIASELHGLHRGDGEGLNLPTVFAVSWTNAPTLMLLMNGQQAPKYLASLSWSDRESEDNDLRSGGKKMLEITDLSELDDKRFDDVIVINFGRLADTAPESIREVARG